MDSDSQTRKVATQLNEKQRACLRLVLQLKTSKEIARELGISPHTVDRRLKDAMERLGAASRFEAAQMLAAADHYQSLAYQAPALAPPGSPPSDRDDRSGDAAANKLEAGSETDGEDLPPRLARLDRSGKVPPGPSYGPIQKLLLIGVVAIVSALAFGAVLSGLEALVRLCS